MATKLSKAEKAKTKALLADAKQLAQRQKEKAAAKAAKQIKLPADFKPYVPSRTPAPDTSRRPSSRAFASNKAVIDTLVAPEKININYPSTMSGSRDSQRKAFADNKTGASKNYKMVNGKMVEISEAEWNQAAKKFVKQEGTGRGTIKAGQTTANPSRMDVLKKAVAKVQGKKGVDTGLSAAERKMAREGIAPPRKPATPPTAAPATTTTTATATKMTRAERSAANKAQHAVVRAAEEKKWAEQKSAKTKTTAKPAATTAAPKTPAAAKPATKPAPKTATAKPATTAKPKPAATAKPKPAATAKPKVAAAAKPASTSAATAAPSAPKAGIMSRLKSAGKNFFSVKGLGVELAGSTASTLVRGDGKSSARNIAATVIDDATTGYAVGRQYGALAGATVGLIRSSYEEGKRTGKAPMALPSVAKPVVNASPTAAKAPLALPSAPKFGGTFGGQKSAAATGSAGPRTRGGARGASRTAAAPAPAKPRQAATTAKKGTSGFGEAFKQARQARLAGKAGDTFQYGGKTYTSYQRGEQPKAAATSKANPQRAIADFENKMRSAGAISIAGGVGGKPSMIPQASEMTAKQLEEKFKKVKGPR